MRLPPHSEEAEQGVIGCCLQSQAALAESQAVITSPEYFHDIRLGTIWEAICQIEPTRVDVISVIQKLKDMGQLQGMDRGFIPGLPDVVPSAANISLYLDVVRQKYILRKTIRKCESLISACYGPCVDADRFLDAAERDILEIRPHAATSKGIRALVTEAVDKFEAKLADPYKLGGLETGLRDLDRLTDGLHGGELIVVAGFPSTGKTALAVNMAAHNARAGIAAGIFSAEMKPVQLVVRSICSEARVNFKRLESQNIAKITAPASKLANSPLYIESASGLSIGQVAARSRRMKQQHGVRVIVVDYIQLLTGTGDNREQEISSISKGLKSIALENDMAVIALSQLTDDGKLRESRAIGQDADSVWKLENEGEWMPDIQPIKLRVEKCRDGETGLVPLTFIKKYTRFECPSPVEE